MAEMVEPEAGAVQGQKEGMLGVEAEEEEIVDGTLSMVPMRSSEAQSTRRWQQTMVAVKAGSAARRDRDDT